MKTISLDLRERILTAYDTGEVTRAEVGQRFRVSEAMVTKLLQQRRRTGEIGPRHYRSGRRPRILPAHREQLRTLLAQKPDLTLAELRSALALTCTLPAIHYVLAAMDLTYKKTLHAAEQNRPGAAGAGSKAGSIPRSERLVASCPHGHWRTTTMISAIRVDGSTACMTIDGATDTAVF